MASRSDLRRRPRLTPFADQQSLQERTYQALRSALLEGDYLPGERLYEVAIAQSLGVSRNPVREAVRRLQQDGLLELRPHYGIYVAAVPAEEVEDIYRLRSALVGVAAALAAERLTDTEIAELGRIVAEQQAGLVQPTPRSRAPSSIVHADRFHHAIHVGARSPRLLALLEQIYAQVMHFRKLTLRYPGRAEISAEGHAQIYEALRRRNAEEAERLVREHIDGARRTLVRELSEVVDSRARQAAR